jgi:pyruvate dehydrogenase E2 component (dihydrolipoamide acetyltransferase)
VAVEIVMPRLSDSMEEGAIIEWLVAEGDEVKPGDPLVEVETDKATVVYAAEDAGTVLRLHAGIGASVTVGAVIATIGARARTSARPLLPSPRPPRPLLLSPRPSPRPSRPPLRALLRAPRHPRRPSTVASRPRRSPAASPPRWGWTSPPWWAPALTAA